MKKRMYRKVLKKLLTLHPKGLKGHPLKRVKKLAGLICGMLLRKESTMSAVGSGIPQHITAHSKEKACKLFLDNAWNDYETHYLPYMETFLPEFLGGHAMQDSKVYMAIDGSQMGNQHVALMLSLVYKNRSIPLCWVVKKGGKGHFTNEMHLALVQQFYDLLAHLLPSEAQVILLGDGEFDSIELQNFCRTTGWDYVFRTACNTMMYEENDRFKPKDLALSQGADHLFIPNVDFTHKRLAHVHFLLWHAPEYDDPIPLISSLMCVEAIMKAYKKRFAIECLFKDLKSNSFKLHKTRLKEALAISNLIMVAAFALTLLIKLATQYDQKEIRKYLHRIRRDRAVCSIFWFGLQLLAHFLENDLEFDFQFSKFSKNSS